MHGYALIIYDDTDFMFLHPLSQHGIIQPDCVGHISDDRLKRKILKKGGVEDEPLRNLPLRPPRRGRERR